MKREQRKRMEMYVDTYSFLNKAPIAILNKMPQINEAMIQLNNNITNIKSLDRLSTNNTKGQTINKKITKLKLANNLYNLAAALKSFAININNEELIKAVSFGQSELKKQTDLRIMATAILLINKATGHIMHLAPYGITPATLADTQQHNQDFSISCVTPRNLISEKVSAKQMLKETFTKNNKLLKITIDSLVNMVKETDHQFYRGYKIHRELAKPMQIPFALRVNVVNEKNEPIHKVTIKIKGSNKIHKTSPKGTIHVKSIPEGLRTLTASIPGYITQTVKFPRIKTKRTDLRIILQAV